MEFLYRPPTRDEHNRVKLKLQAAEKELRQMQDVAAGVIKELASVERTLRHEIKLRKDMHAGVQAAKESLDQVRKIHQPFDTTGPLTTKHYCAGCGGEWPCRTLNAIREPELLVITSLQEMKLELETSLQDSQGDDKSQS